MEHVRIKELMKNKKFLERIRWDITPKVLFEPRFPGTKDEQGKTTSSIDGYMLYVDLVYDRPGLVVMNVQYSMSKTVAYVEDVPEDLLREAMNCTPEECKAGMYPLTKKLEGWLKKAFGLL